MSLTSEYKSQLTTLQAIFSDWTEEDLLFALQDADGDLDLTIDRIAEGHAKQWETTKKKTKKEPLSTEPATVETVTPVAAAKAPRATTKPSRSNNTANNKKTTWQQKSNFANKNDPWNKPTPAIAAVKTANNEKPKSWAALLHNMEERKPKDEPVKEEVKEVQEVEEPITAKDQDYELSIDFNKLNIQQVIMSEEKEEIKPLEETTTTTTMKNNEYHPSVAEIFNSVQPPSFDINQPQFYQQQPLYNQFNGYYNGYYQPPIQQQQYYQQQPSNNHLNNVFNTTTITTSASTTNRYTSPYYNYHQDMAQFYNSNNNTPYYNNDQYWK